MTASRRPDPKEIGQGIVTIGVVLAVQKSAPLLKRFFKRLGRIVFSWKDYSEHIREQSVRRGVIEGRAPWLAAGALFWGARALRRSRRRRQRVVLKEVLAPNERVTIIQVPRKQARSRRLSA